MHRPCAAQCAQPQALWWFARHRDLRSPPPKQGPIQTCGGSFALHAHRQAGHRTPGAHDSAERVADHGTGPSRTLGGCRRHDAPLGAPPGGSEHAPACAPPPLRCTGPAPSSISLASERGAGPANGGGGLGLCVGSAHWAPREALTAAGSRPPPPPARPPRAGRGGAGVHATTHPFQRTSVSRRRRIHLYLGPRHILCRQHKSRVMDPPSPHTRTSCVTYGDAGTGMA